MPKVMLVEDDMTMLVLLRTLLELEGYDVTEIQPQEDVLDSIRSERPDVVLMDVHLRGTSGLTLLQNIRQDEELLNTRILMSSGADLRYECQRAGADGFLLKPFSPDDLIKKLRVAMA